MTQQQRKAKRDRQREIHRQKKFIRAYLILIVLIIIMFFIIIGNQNASAVQINDLREEIVQAEQVVEEVDKVGVIDEKEGYRLTEQERDMVCRVVAAESRGCDLQGQMGVAQVILDRSQLWDMTVTEVVTAPNQFAMPYKGEISDKTYLAVSNIFDGKIRVFEGDTTHFHDDSVQPYWADNKINRGNIGRMSFYGN